MKNIKQEDYGYYIGNMHIGGKIRMHYPNKKEQMNYYSFYHGCDKEELFVNVLNNYSYEKFIKNKTLLK